MFFLSARVRRAEPSRASTRSERLSIRRGERRGMNHPSPLVSDMNSVTLWLTQWEVGSEEQEGEKEETLWTAWDSSSLQGSRASSMEIPFVIKVEFFLFIRCTRRSSSWRRCYCVILGCCWDIFFGFHVIILGMESAIWCSL